MFIKSLQNKGLTNKRKCDIIDKHSSRGTKNRVRKKRARSKKSIFDCKASWKLNNERPKETLENSEQSLNKAKLRIIKEVKKRLKNWKSVLENWTG